jgi:transcriptional regulator with PAS, ATPase and Fis domain
VAVIGEHPAMQLVLDRVEQIADTDASVLIRGETGTGKEVVARLIHGASTRRAGPFVAVNVAAIPEALAEAELFGHVRGAYTGADKARTGRFVAAHRGTLFLDEVGEMPRAVQVKLLRALQEREVTPVGGSEAIPIDVRVIAATHRNLEAMIAEGTFREDLFYRLDVVPIEIPPLRERRLDVPVLAEHFRLDVNAREARSVPGFALDVMQRLCAYDWPGNVRELENLIERLVVVAANRMVVMEDLPAHMRTTVVDLENATLDLPESGVDLRVFLAQLEERLIAQALERTGGNKNRAAELLGMNRTTLVEKLRRRNVA